MLRFGRTDYVRAVDQYNQVVMAEGELRGRGCFCLRTKPEQFVFDHERKR